jgi:hypothetical protein
LPRFVRKPYLFPLAAALALLGLVASSALAAPAGTTLLVSRPTGTGLFTPPKDGSANASAQLAVSDDGRYVAFVSSAPGLDPAAMPFVENVYLRDTVANTTTLVSRSDGAGGAAANTDAGTGGGVFSQDTLSIAVQPVGAGGDAPHNQTHVLVAFSTKATNLVDHTDRALEPTAGRVAVWMRDVTAGTTYLVSRANGKTGALADDDSYQPSMAPGPGGALVAYTSKATNLFQPGPTDRNFAVYLREVGTGISHKIDQPPCAIDSCSFGIPPGVSDQPSLRSVTGTSNGVMCRAGQQCAVVAYMHSFPSDPSHQQAVVSTAFMLADGTVDEFRDYRVASAAGGDSTTTFADTGAQQPQLTSDGEGVAFLSNASNLVGPIFGVEGKMTAYLTRIGQHGLRLLSSASIPGHFQELPNADVAHLAVGATSLDPVPGMVVAASNWGAPPLFGFGLRAWAVPGGTNVADVLLLDRAADGTAGDRPSAGTEISADGKTAVFWSASSNLGAGGGAEFVRVYKRVLDPAAPGFGRLQLVSRPTGTAPYPQGDTASGITNRAVSADGRFVAFQTTDADLVPGNATGPLVQHIFVRDTVNGTTTLVDRASGASGAPADSGANLVGISDDGRRVMFTSGSAGLCAGCDRDLYAYVRDLTANTTILVSRQTGADGGPVGVEPSRQSLSGDGNRAAFATTFAMEPAAANNQDHLYVRDIARSTTTFVDREDGARGAAANRGPRESSLNRDGSKVAWTSVALLAGTPFTPTPQLHVFVRDLTAGTTVVASRADGAGGAVADGDSQSVVIDAAGDAVAFESTATNLGSVSHRAIWVRRLDTNRTLLVSRASGAAGAPSDADAFAPSIDAAGDKVAFVSRANNLGALEAGRPPTGPGPGLDVVRGSQAYVRDVNANVTELASRANGVNGFRAEPGGSVEVSISANGACAAFSGTGLDFTDPLAGLPYPAVRERALTSSCGVGTVGAIAVGVDDVPPSIGLDAPPPPQASVPVPVPVRATAAALSRLLASPTRFFVGAGGGTRLSFTLSKPATVTVAFARLVASGARRGRCTAGAHAGRPCTIARPVGRLTVHAHAGVNRIRFSGRIGRRALAPGTYGWTATPLHGRARSGRFTIVRAPRAGSARRAR